MDVRVWDFRLTLPISLKALRNFTLRVRQPAELADNIGRINWGDKVVPRDWTERELILMFLTIKHMCNSLHVPYDFYTAALENIFRLYTHLPSSYWNRVKVVTEPLVTDDGPIMTLGLCSSYKKAWKKVEKILDARKD